MDGPMAPAKYLLTCQWGGILRYQKMLLQGNNGLGFFSPTLGNRATEAGGNLRRSASKHVDGKQSKAKREVVLMKARAAVLALEEKTRLASPKEDVPEPFSPVSLRESVDHPTSVMEKYSTGKETSYGYYGKNDSYNDSSYGESTGDSSVGSIGYRDQPKGIRTAWAEEEDEGLTPTGHTYDWNAPYQALMTQLTRERIFSNDKLQMYTELTRLEANFVHAARNYGMIIIDEVFLPAEEKTLKPIRGGIMGGTKFIAHNIYFKFAVSNEKTKEFFGDYGDEAASKIAGHELKSRNVLFNATCSLRFAMMVLIDYRGFRLIAESLVPVGKKSLVYGTEDGGITIHQDDREVATMVETLGTKLNLKPHSLTHCSSVFYTPADLEIHLGRDEKYYCLDFSRLLPPEARSKQRDKNKKGSIFYKLLRPELVMSYPKPLCSDTYSGFVKGTDEEPQSRKEIEEATQHMFNTVIPNLAKLLDSMAETYKFIDTSKKQIIVIKTHAYGINIRHLGMENFHVELILKDESGEPWKLRSSRRASSWK